MDRVQQDGEDQSTAVVGGTVWLLERLTQEPAGGECDTSTRAHPPVVHRVSDCGHERPGVKCCFTAVFDDQCRAFC